MTLSHDERLALSDVLEYATNDRWDYLANGNPDHDYGYEWPMVARQNALCFRTVATLMTRLGIYGQADEMLKLAESYEASANEYRNAEVGN